MTIVHDDDSENNDDIPELNQNIVSDDESSDEEDDRKDSEGETDGLEVGEDFEGEMDGYEEGESEIKTPSTNPKLRKELKNLETFYNPTNPKLLKELKNMDTFYNPTMTVDKTGREESETARLLIDVAKVTDNQRDDATKQQPFEEPKTFQQAWYHPDEYQCKMWREAIRKEYQDMIKHKVWRRTSKRQIPSNRRCIKCKWVFKIKRNGVFRARLVALSSGK